jgi:hypothetical protein
VALFERGILRGRPAQGFFISNNATRACLSMASAGGTPEQAGDWQEEELEEVAAGLRFDALLPSFNMMLATY